MSPSRTARMAPALPALLMLVCGESPGQAARGQTSTSVPPQTVVLPTTAQEAAFALTRRLPREYAEACVEILRETQVNPCPPLVPEGAMEIQGGGDSLDVMSGVLGTIDGHEIDAHGGHWTIWVVNTKGGRQALADHMHAAGAKTPSQCRVFKIEGQRVEACRVPPYPEGGYYGNHIAYGWRRGDVAYNITMHNHANEPRLRLMVAAWLRQEMTPRVRPRFETATITRCADPAIGGALQLASLTRESDTLSPGRVALSCRTLESLAAMAYVQYADGLAHARSTVGRGGTLIAGGAAWLRSETYSIEASASATAPRAMMLGPMLQTLLEERFRLRVRREHREVSAFELIRGDGWHLKLDRFTAERCTPQDFPLEGVDRVTLPGGQRWCSSGISSDATRSRLDMEGTTIQELSRFLSSQPFIGRYVSDRSGVPGRYDFHVDFAPAAANASPDDLRASFVAALEERHGLKLRPATADAQFLVVERSRR